MKSRIISLGLVASLVCLLPQVAEAQIAASNPLEWTALAEGNELINGQIEKQIKGQTQTALLQNSIATEKKCKKTSTEGRMPRYPQRI
mgnify:CR=1 FL=1